MWPNFSPLENPGWVFQVRVIDNHWTPCLLGFINASLRDNEGLRSSFILYRGAWGLKGVLVVSVRVEGPDFLGGMPGIMRSMQVGLLGRGLCPLGESGFPQEFLRVLVFYGVLRGVP